MKDVRYNDLVLGYGGYVIPAQLMDEMVRQILAESPWPRSEHEPIRLTWRMRYRLWRADVRERIHDRLFPEYRRGDYWDDE